MQRRSERNIGDIDFPSRYVLDEARFHGGREHIHNKEAHDHEPQPHYT